MTPQEEIIEQMKKDFDGDTRMWAVFFMIASCKWPELKPHFAEWTKRQAQITS